MPPHTCSVQPSWHEKEEKALREFLEKENGMSSEKLLILIFALNN